MEEVNPKMAQVFTDEDKARKWLESKLWPNGPVCPHCASDDVYDLAQSRAGLYKCGRCKKQFTVRIGTIMEQSKIPICKWLRAIHLMTSEKGASSRQIARACGITQKSAWFLNHRIREAMKQARTADECTFRELADQWRSETDIYSSVTQKINHPAYQRIISMGDKALPWILRELRDRPNLWFNALRTIAKETPVPETQRANAKFAREAWLDWGRRKGLID